MSLVQPSTEQSCKTENKKKIFKGLLSRITSFKNYIPPIEFYTQQKHTQSFPLINSVGFVLI